MAQVLQRDVYPPPKTHVRVFFFLLHVHRVSQLQQQLKGRLGKTSLVSIFFFADFNQLLLNGYYSIAGANGGTYLADSTKVTVVLGK